MNSTSDPPGVITRSMARKRKIEEANIKDVVPTKNSRFSGPYRYQQWPFRNPLIEYIIKNATAKFHQKLIQSCKYYFAKKPIFLIPYLWVENEKWNTCIDNKPFVIGKDTACKLWISGSIYVMLTANSSIFSLLAPKIYQCNVERLKIHDQNISYNDFMLISSSVKHCDLIHVHIKYEDGTIVPFEKIFEGLPKVKRFIYEGCFPATSITSSTFTELVKIPHFSGLESLYLSQIPETFDLAAFFTYMQENKFTKFNLSFHASISEFFKFVLEIIVDEIIAAERKNDMLTKIHFSGLDSTKSKRLRAIFDGVTY